MKVLMINGSPHPKGNTQTALNEMIKIFDQQNIDTEIIHIGNKDRMYVMQEKWKMYF